MVYVLLQYTNWRVRERIVRFPSLAVYLDACRRYHPDNPQRRRGMRVLRVKET